jgi:hypothetical protein
MSNTVEVMNAGLPIVAAHAASSMSTTGEHRRHSGPGHESLDVVRGRRTERIMPSSWRGRGYRCCDLSADSRRRSTRTSSLAPRNASVRAWASGSSRGRNRRASSSWLTSSWPGSSEPGCAVLPSKALRYVPPRSSSARNERRRPACLIGGTLIYPGWRARPALPRPETRRRDAGLPIRTLRR